MHRACKSSARPPPHSLNMLFFPGVSFAESLIVPGAVEAILCLMEYPAARASPAPRVLRAPACPGPGGHDPSRKTSGFVPLRPQLCCWGVHWTKCWTARLSLLQKALGSVLPTAGYSFYIGYYEVPCSQPGALNIPAPSKYWEKMGIEIIHLEVLPLLSKPVPGPAPAAAWCYPVCACLVTNGICAMAMATLDLPGESRTRTDGEATGDGLGDVKLLMRV